MIGDSLVSTDDNFFGSDEVIQLGLYGIKVIVAILLNIDRITLGRDIGTDMGYLDGYFYLSKYGKLEVLLIVDPLVYTDSKVLVYDEGIKLVYTDGEVIGTILGDVDIITLRLDFVTELGSLYGYFYGSNDGKIEGLLL